MAETIKPKCKDCGLLTLWRDTVSGEYGELRWQERESGLPYDITGQWPGTMYFDAKEYSPSDFRANKHDHWPRCFVNAVDLSYEMQNIKRAAAPQDYDIYGEDAYNEAGGDGQSIQHKLMASELASRFRFVIQEPRDCKQFFPWAQGFSPKEHVEMQLRERQQAFQARLEKELLESQNAAHAKLAAAQEATQERLVNLQLNAQTALVEKQVTAQWHGALIAAGAGFFGAVLGAVLTVILTVLLMRPTAPSP